WRESRVLRPRHELGESSYSQPARPDYSLRHCPELALALRAYHRSDHLSRRRDYRFFRWRDRAPISDGDEFWPVDGSARRQDHDRGGVHLARASARYSSLGRDGGSRSRISHYRIAFDGERKRPGAFIRELGQTQNILANYYRDFFSHPAGHGGLDARPHHALVVATSLGRSRHRAGMAHRCAHALLRTGLRVAPSRRRRDRSLTREKLCY